MPLINIRVHVAYFLNRTTPMFLTLDGAATASGGDAPLLRVKCSMASAVNATKKKLINAGMDITNPLTEVARE